ncbi:MAG: protein-S-isoprenylcysteine O-methyltransferase [Pseudomonadota bacterium]
MRTKSSPHRAVFLEVGALINNLIPFGIMIAAGAAAMWRGAPYPALVFLALLAACFAIRLWLTSGPDKEVAEQRHKSRESVMVFLVFLGMALVPIVTIGTPIFDFAAYIASPLQLTAGIVVGVAGLFLFWRSHADLGKNWSAELELRREHELVVSGVYRFIRHPMYSAIFLIVFGQLLVLNNWIAGPLGLVAFLILYLMRIDAEELMMKDQFGDSWEEYADRTPRLIPHLKG